MLVEPTEDEEEEEQSDAPGVGESEGPDLPDSDESELSAEQLKAYLENLRPEDFGKFNP